GGILICGVGICVCIGAPACARCSAGFVGAGSGVGFGAVSGAMPSASASDCPGFGGFMIFGNGFGTGLDPVASAIPPPVSFVSAMMIIAAVTCARLYAFA